MGVCRPEAFGRAIPHRRITHFEDRFRLVESLPFVSVLQLPAPTALHAQPSERSDSIIVPAGHHVALRRPDGDWVEATRLLDDGRLQSGWLRREAVMTGRWVEQVAMTSAHRFRVAVSGDAEEDDLETFGVQVIDRSTGTSVQWIDGPIGVGARPPEAELLSLVDANFDGRLDLMLTQHDGGAGPNNTKAVYLFDPTSQRYTFDPVLAELPQLSIDAKTQTIRSASRNSCCSHTHSTWRYLGGKLTMVAERDESLTADGEWMQITEGRWVRGKMVYRSRRIKPPH